MNTGNRAYTFITTRFGQTAAVVSGKVVLAQHQPSWGQYYLLVHSNFETPLPDENHDMHISLLSFDVSSKRQAKVSSKLELPRGFSLRKRFLFTYLCIRPGPDNSNVLPFLVRERDTLPLSSAID